MIVDVRLMYDSGTINVRSDAARFSKTVPSIIAFASEYGETEEKIEGVGVPIDELRSAIRHFRPEGSHSYRFVDPLAKETFHAETAMALVRHFCFVVHNALVPARSPWRLVFFLDSFRVFLSLPGYKLVPLKERIRFEKLLKQRRIRLVSG